MKYINGAEIKVQNGGTPMSIADAVIREVNDKEILEDIIYYLQVYINREYTSEVSNDERL